MELFLKSRHRLNRWATKPLFRWRLQRTLPDLKSLANHLRKNWPVEDIELPGGFQVRGWANDPLVISVCRFGTLGQVSVIGFTHRFPSDGLDFSVVAGNHGATVEHRPDGTRPQTHSRTYWDPLENVTVHYVLRIWSELERDWYVAEYDMKLD